MLKGKIKDPLFYCGIITLTVYLWYVYLYFNTQKPEFLLWYSQLGLMFLSLALLLRSYILISIAFCSLFFIEGFWFVNFITALFFDFSLGNIGYKFIPGSPDFDFLGSVYHLILAPLSLVGVLVADRIYKLAWVYSSLLALILGLLTYILLDNSDGENINCIFNSCEQLFSIVYRFPNPYRIFLGCILLSLFIFLPSNKLIIIIKKIQKSILDSSYKSVSGNSQSEKTIRL